MSVLAVTGDNGQTSHEVGYGPVNKQGSRFDDSRSCRRPTAVVGSPPARTIFVGPMRRQKAPPFPNGLARRRHGAGHRPRRACWVAGHGRCCRRGAIRTRRGDDLRAACLAAICRLPCLRSRSCLVKLPSLRAQRASGGRRVTGVGSGRRRGPSKRGVLSAARAKGEHHYCAMEPVGQFHRWLQEFVATPLFRTWLSVE